MKKCLSNILLSVILLLVSCQIDPPLYLPDKDNEPVDVTIPIVITDISVLWNVNFEEYIDTAWYYGWDEKDERLFGGMNPYTIPNTFNIIDYYHNGTDGSYNNTDHFIVNGYTFRRQYRYGNHDMELWSEPSTQDNSTQYIIIDETDRYDIKAYTNHSTHLNSAYNQPEVIYSGNIYNIHITPNIEDYDYYDPIEKVYVKTLNTMLYPLVYTYLIQVILLNNNDKVINVSPSPYISGFSNITNVIDGNNGHHNANILYTSRFKKEVDYNGEKASACGSKLLTFGKSGLIDGYGRQNKFTRANIERTYDDVDNIITMGFKFYNDCDSVYRFNVTSQVNEHLNGGIITLVIDCDTLKTPYSKNNGGIFEPYVKDYDEIVYDITM